MGQADEWQRVESVEDASKLVCSSCGADANVSWARCRSCASSLDDAIPMARVTQEEPEGDEGKEDVSGLSEGSWESCPSCGAKVASGWSFCRSCEYSLDDATPMARGTQEEPERDQYPPSLSNTEQSASSGLLAAVSDSFKSGENLRTYAREYLNTGDWDRALETYDEAQDAYEDALETANESDLIDTDQIEQRLIEVAEERQEVHRQQLQDEIESLRSELDHADTIAGDGKLERAQERLTDLESRLTSAMETATQHDIDGLQDEIATLEQRREKRLTDVTERLEAYPVPEEIPDAPVVSVDYDALTDKEPIGGGGNADVTKAKISTPDGDVTVAIKEPRLSGTMHTDQVERMLKEAETWDRLDDHDHIVGVVDYGSQPVPWIAMEYMNGGHLGDRSDEMDIQQALWTALAVTKGVRHAHIRGVAHLDLKPENVLFRSVEDMWDVPKVADWGLSKHLLKHSKSIEGLSPHYAAPEQFEKEYGPADNVTDVYQLGAVFYELFTSQPLFEGSPTQVMQAVMNKQPTPPSEVADVPAELDGILLSALAKEKEDRYDDVLYLRDSLQELFDNW